MDNKGSGFGAASGAGKTAGGGAAGVTGSAKNSIKPGFLGGAGGGEKPAGLASRNAAGASVLGAAEDAASDDLDEQNDDSLDGARDGEENVDSLYSGTGRESRGKDLKKKIILGAVKKRGPIAAILAVIGSSVGLMSGAQTLMPMAIEEMIIEKFNSIGISSTMASDAWLNAQLNQSVQLKYEPTGELANLFGFSEKQVSAFEQNGIKVCSNIGDGTTNMTALLFREGFSWTPVVGSDMMSLPQDVVISSIKANCNVSTAIINSPISTTQAMANDKFFVAYTRASKTWRGGVSGWFDKTMKNVTETKLNINRNRWARYVAQNISNIANDLKEFNETASGVINKTKDDGIVNERFTNDKGEGVDISNNAQAKTSKTEPVDVNDVPLDGLDELNSSEKAQLNAINGNDKTVSVSDSTISGNTPSAVSNLSKVLNSKAMKAALNISEASCAVLEGVVTIYTIASAYQSMQFLNLVTGFLEAVDKVKAGQDSSSPISAYTNNLTNPADTIGDDGNVTSSGKTAMMSAGISWLFMPNNSVASQNDPSIRNVNFETIMSSMGTLTRNIRLTSEVYKKCGYVKAGSAAVDLVTTILSFIPYAGQAIKIAQISWKAIAKAAVKATVQIAFYVIIPIAAKNIAKMMIKNAATEWFGEDLGNAMVSGANKYLGGNATSGGQSPASAPKVTAYLTERETVLANEARYDRLTRSPFDITSKNTFLGSLFYSFIPIAFSSGGMVSLLSKTKNFVSSSIAALSPAATALSAQGIMNSTGDCDLLSTTTAVGDAYCNPYIVTDVSTMYESPIAVNNIVYNMKNNGSAIAANGEWKNVSSDNFDDNGAVKNDSNLARYLVYCGQRTSQYGLKDMNIASQVSGEDKTVSKIAGVVPLVNNVKDVITGLKDAANLGWATGSACVASDENEYWDELKWYQRYAENNRLLENMNPDYKSPVTAFLEDYHKENPVDNSFEGTLARFSGLTKEKTEEGLALIQYYNYLANYDPTTRFAFGQEVKPADANELKFDNDNKVAYYVLLNDIEFADVRNRNFAI